VETRESFNLVYKQELEPQVLQFNKLSGKNAYGVSWEVAIYGSALLIAIAVYFIGLSLEFALILGFMLLSIGSAILKSKKQVTALMPIDIYRDEIMPRLVRCCSRQLIFLPDEEMNIMSVQFSNLFENGNPQAGMIEGYHGGNHIRMSQLHAYGGGKAEVLKFNGLFIYTTLPLEYENEIVIYPIGGYDEYRHTLTAFNGGFGKVEIEDEIFNSKYRVYSTHPRGAKEWLDEYVRKRILEVEAKTPFHLSFAFARSNLFVAADTGDVLSAHDKDIITEELLFSKAECINYTLQAVSEIIDEL
jgi:hypothetical protein